MTQIEKYTWLIQTILRRGRISLDEISDLWQRNINMSDGRELNRMTFNRWREAILSQFGINIVCQRVGGYQYYIENPEEIENDRLRKWMLDSFATGNIISENLALKCRIVVDEIPSGREHLTTLIEAMKDNRVVEITYKPFKQSHGSTFSIEPYCVKLFENRWYVLGRNNFGDIRIYALNRLERVEPTGRTFKLPKDFDAEQFFRNYYGIVIGQGSKPERIVIRANEDHKNYLKSLPLHHSQRLIEDCGEYADFELYLVPTYDFIMKLLQVGAMVEVIEPSTLRNEMKGWISEVYELYMERRFPTAGQN